MKLPGRNITSGGMEGQYFARIHVEQAEIDLDVAVGRLNAAELQNALHGHAPGTGRPRARPATFSAK